MPLSPCQDMAKNEIAEFLLSEDEPLMILSAQAGRGKTWLCNEYLSDIDAVRKLPGLHDAEFDGCFKTAMSNKAAQVLGGVTLDKHFGLRPKNDYKTGKSYRIKAGSGNSYSGSIINIDEGSMLDHNALGHVADLTHNCKTIISCDQYQLGPVQGKNPIFDMGLRTVDMTTSMRQEADSPHDALCTKLREGVRDGIEHRLTECDKVKFIGDDEAMQFVAEMTTNDKVLCYQNKPAKKLNAHVRAAKGLKGFWQPGERLVSNGIILQGNQVILSNEEHVDVLDVSSEITVNAFDIECRWVETSLGAFHVPVEPESVTALLSSLAKAGEWKKFYAAKDTIPDFRGTWSSTVHKAQGSTYDTVLIHIQDLLEAKKHNFDMYLRLLYVAVSRAKSRVLIYG